MARSGKLVRIFQFAAAFVALSLAYQTLQKGSGQISESGSSSTGRQGSQPASKSGPLSSAQRQEKKVASLRKTLSHQKIISGNGDGGHADEPRAKPAKSSDVGSEDIDNERATSKKVAEARPSDTAGFRKTSVCNRPWKTDWDMINRDIEPSILLNPDRFVYPLLVNGPNNQLIGLRDAIYLAVRLNRTVILPRFYKHRTDTTLANRSSAFIPASQRIDVASLAKLVTVLPHRSVLHLCRDGFDDLYFPSAHAMDSSLTHVVDDVGVPIRNKHSGEPAHEYPANPDAAFSERMRSDKRYMRKLYGSAGRCALYAGPYRSVGVKESVQTLRRTRKDFFNRNGSILPGRIEPDKLADGDLYALIVHSTPKPMHVAAIVDDFMDVYGLSDVAYVSIHWRYDYDDWQRRCRKGKGPEDFVSEMCEKVKHMVPDDIARGVLRFVRELEAKTGERIVAVYFAAPLAMELFVEQVEMSLERVREEKGAVEVLRVFTQANLHDHLANFKSCEGLKENYDDLFSQLEMDVCSRAKAFLRSPSSSWSKVIKERRVIKSMDKYDGDILKLAWGAAERRLNE